MNVNVKGWGRCRRASQLAEIIQRYDPDFVVLTETREDIVQYGLTSQCQVSLMAPSATGRGWLLAAQNVC